MSKTTFTLKRKLFTTFNGVSAANRVANPLPTAATSAFNQLPENFNKMGKQAQINTSMKAAKETMKNNSVATLNSTKPNFSTRFKQAGGWGKVGKIGLGVGAGAVALGALGVFGAKKAISKAGEQSDGSKLFSQTKKDNMATTYRLKRKTFASIFLDHSTGQVLNGADAGKRNQAYYDSLGQELKKNPTNTTLEKIGSREGWGGTRSNYSGTVSTSEAVKAAQKRAASNVGIKQGFKNSWGRMGTMGKAGVIGAGVVGAGLMAKGLFGGKKKDQ